ncbi:hypothetical protein BKA67DRAFT_545743 [Truncatella angustata]|uniref:RNA polymerase I-specific transcription initiation factor rrn5 n=1 Tax=Truncatella angustata TaxID=152316 RepID=A0A9P8UWS1_9PEZI|nr:uncharacterized protein BKA67DRAFT_545743 [Truncatella angustata]KAH6659772.1 hypothetical protein BKA67DRAFT_545743 [Truncatella angustata]
MGTASDEEDYVPSDAEDAVASEHESAGDDSDASSHRLPRQPTSRGGISDGAEEESDASSTPSISSTSRKRPAHHLAPYAGAPLKRQRRTFNPDYLSLLNQDIADASASLIAPDTLDLSPSQIGAVRWTAVEKEAFFSALGRLGRDDLPGIAARMGSASKGPLEVRQYMMLLEERTRQRRADGELRRRTPRPAEIPAATEVSHECAVALEEAADDLALRQENHEVGVEERRWGDRWLITRKVREEELGGEGQEDGNEMPFLEFFNVRTWLRLSERVFMNSVIPDYNWQYVSEEPPAIRATALSDFHALVVSVTKRLVASTLFMAGMRIKAHKEYMPFTKNLVKPKDVKAALDSLNMKTDSRDFWARAPRRLRLDIMAEEQESSENIAEEESEAELAMSYDEVEAALGVSSVNDTVTLEAKEANSDAEEGSDVDSDLSSPEDDGLAAEIGDQGNMGIDNSLDEEAIKHDMREAMYFSADYQFTTRARQGLQGRIEAEHRMEAEADEQDFHFSRHEEALLWSILHRTDPPAEIPARDEKATLSVWTFGLTPAAPNWRENTPYISEWEVQ